MKKIVSILLTLLLLVGLMPIAALAESRPADDAEAHVWERYADSLEESDMLKEAAAAFKIAADKYSECIEENLSYFSSANSCYNRAIELYKAEEMYDEVSQCYEAIGDAAFRCNKYKEAKFAYAQVIGITKNFGLKNDNLFAVHEKVGDVCVNLGEFGIAANEYLNAIDCADSSAETFASLCLKYAEALEADGLQDDPEGEERIAKAFTDAAKAFTVRAKGDEAIAAMKKGAKHYENAGDLESAKRAYSSLIFELAQNGMNDFAASLCFDLYNTYGANEYAAALLTNVALPYYESIEDYGSAALAYEKAGDCYKEIGIKDLAKQCYEKAAEYYEKAGDTANAEAVKEKIKNSFAAGSIISNGKSGMLIMILVIAVLILVAAGIFFKRKKNIGKK